MRAAKFWLALALPCLALARQEESKPAPAPQVESGETSLELKRVYVAELPASLQADRKAWSVRLAASNLDRREVAFEELVRKARTDDYLHLMLEEFAVDPANPDRAWTARLALRELIRTNAQLALASMQSTGPRVDRGRLTSLQQELEDALLRVDDPHFGGWVRGFNQDLNSILGESKPGCAQESKCFNLEIAPDGVRCKLFECIDGQQVKKEYRADSYEELLEAHPELRVHVDRNGPAPKGLDYAPRPFLGGVEGQAELAASTPNRVDLLGIKTVDPVKGRAKKFGLGDGQGLLVIRITTGSLASVLGMQRGDILAEIGGVKIFTAAEVRRILSERDAKAEIRVVVFNTRGQRKELIWQPGF